MKKIPLIVSTLLWSTSLNMGTLISQASAEIPEPECITAYGLSGSNETACGYNCKKSGNGERVACADWPRGKCQAGYTSVSCGPPAPNNWTRDYQDDNSNYGNRDRNRNCDCDCR